LIGFDAYNIFLTRDLARINRLHLASATTGLQPVAALSRACIKTKNSAAASGQ